MKKCVSSFKKASLFLTSYYLAVLYITAANLHSLTDFNFENSFGIDCYVAIRLPSFKLFWSETAEIIAIEYRRPNIRSTFFASIKFSFFPVYYIVVLQIIAANLHFFIDFYFENSFGIIYDGVIRLPNFNLFRSETAEISANSLKLSQTSISYQNFIFKTDLETLNPAVNNDQV